MVNPAVLPVCDGDTIDELLAWLRVCQFGATAEHVRDASQIVYDRLRRYALAVGLSHAQAREAARRVADPISRAAGELTRASAYLHLTETVMTDVSSEQHPPAGDTDARPGHEAAAGSTTTPTAGAIPLHLDRLPADDPRAVALWYRTGDNSHETPDQTPGYVRLNRYLRDPDSMLPDPKLDTMIAAIDSAMTASRLTAPIIGYRGISADRAARGGSYTDPAYCSITTDPAHAATWGPVVVQVCVPAGIGAVRMADRDPDLPESEILLDRGLRYTLTPDGQLKVDTPKP